MRLIPGSEGLFLGTYEDAMNNNLLASERITHILSVCKMDSSLASTTIAINDLEQTNILTHLSSALQFIEFALASRARILVHCVAGQSRSVTVICGYLMKHRGMSYEDTIAFVQSISADACPNVGFVAQLEMFGEMGCKIDPSHEGYKMFRVATLATEYQENGFVSQANLTTLPTTHTQTLHRCKKCRTSLFLSESLIPHAPSSGQSQFQYFKRDNTPLKACGLYFIEPMGWMAGMRPGPNGIEGIRGVEGKIECPGCQSKLGAFNWYGMQCSCGSWCAPAFSIAKKVVDEMKYIQKPDVVEVAEVEQ